MTTSPVRQTTDDVIAAPGAVSDAYEDLGGDEPVGLLEPLERLSPSAYVGAMAGSILLSLGLYLVGRRNAGIFVGLWAPTFLNLGLYLKQLRPSRSS